MNDGLAGELPSSVVGRSILLDTIAKQLFFSTTMIHCGRCVGTGFFVRYPLPEGGVQYFLVTAKHVIDDDGPGLFALQLGANGQAILGLRASFELEDMRSWWVSHPDPTVDVAVLCLDPFIGKVLSSGEHVGFATVGLEIMPSPELVEEFDFLEDLVFVGYPDGKSDDLLGTPLFRRGITATPVAIPYSGYECFLVDASIYPGSSGSPVYVVQQTYQQGNTLHLADHRVFFVGVLTTGFHSDVTLPSGGSEAAPDAQGVTQLIDLGVVWNWRSVIEALQLAVTSPWPTAPFNYTVGLV